MSGKLKKKSCPPPPCWESSGVSCAAEEATAIVRLSVDTMPSVTVPLSPRGAPIAIATSPTLSLLESANSAGVSPEGSTLMTARSDSGSVPTTVALRTEPSAVCTSRFALEVAPSSVTTWVLVRMWPWSSSTTPEPVPASLPDVAEMVTTEGDAFCVAPVISLTESVLLTITGELFALVDELLPLATAPVPTAVPAPSRPASAMPATIAPAENLRRVFVPPSPGWAAEPPWNDAPS